MSQTRRNPNRIGKVNSLIERQIGAILRPFLEGEEGLVTVSRVETSRDMKWVKVWLSILGGNDDRILNLLNRNLYDIQGQLNRSFETKIIPRIQFFLDTSPRYAQHIGELIERLHGENDDH